MNGLVILVAHFHPEATEQDALNIEKMVSVYFKNAYGTESTPVEISTTTGGEEE